MAVEGAGECAAGLASAGIGAPSDAVDAPTGTTTACRYRDPVTRDYEIDPDTLHARQTSRVKQMILLALQTELESAAAALDFGLSLPRKKHAGTNTQIAANIRSALAHITDTQQLATIQDITVTGYKNRAEVYLSWINHETDETEDVEYPV